MSGRPFEVLLVQHDPQQVKRTLDVLRGRPFAKRIRVISDADQALEFLLGSGPYADQQPAAPGLVLFHLGPGEDDRLGALERIVRDPLTSRFPVTVLTDTADDRLAALGLLRGRNLRLPVVAITDLPAGQPPSSRSRQIDAQPDDQDDGAWIVGGVGERKAPRRARAPQREPEPPGKSELDQQLEALAALARRLAHEFNNLLTVVVANTELLLRDLDLDDPRRASAEEIIRSIERASELTARLMTFGPSDTPASPDPARPPRPRIVKRANRAGAP